MLILIYNLETEVSSGIVFDMRQILADRKCRAGVATFFEESKGKKAQTSGMTSPMERQIISEKLSIAQLTQDVDLPRRFKRLKEEQLWTNICRQRKYPELYALQYHPSPLYASWYSQLVMPGILASIRRKNWLSFGKFLYYENPTYLFDVDF